jgi:hypothetical protein
MIVNFLAELWGISMVIISLALLWKENYFKNLSDSIANDDQKLFCWGIFSAIIGVAMVLGYNVWEWQWQIIITLFGWAALVKGLAMLFLPEQIKTLTGKLAQNQYFSYAPIAVLIVGLILTYLGFTS